MKKLSTRRGRRLKKQDSLPQIVSFGSKAYKKNLARYLGSRPQNWVSKKMISAPKYKPETIILKCPKNFSIVNNPQETLEFFKNSFFHYERKDHACLDLSDVEEITIDVLMYFITLLRILAYEKKEFHFTMKPPSNEDIKNFIVKSGFFDFAKRKELTFENDFMHIHIGDNYKAKDVYKISRFTCDSNDALVERVNPILVELISNVEEHAYEGGSDIPHYWYIFCKKINKYSQIVLMDVGYSIPYRVKKNGIEQIGLYSDEKILLSALKGEQRSGTNKPGRGSGLNIILAKGSPITNLNVISRKAIYQNGNISRGAVEFTGTLFVFDIKE